MLNLVSLLMLLARASIKNSAFELPKLFVGTCTFFLILYRTYKTQSNSIKILLSKPFEKRASSLGIIKHRPHSRPQESLVQCAGRFVILVRRSIVRARLVVL